MTRIIITAVLIVLLAILVVFNLRFTTSVSLYGIQMTDIPVMAVAFVSFALGLVYSLVLYLGRYLRRQSRQRLEQRSREVARREQELSDQPASTPPSTAASEGSTAAGGASADTPTPPRARFRLFRRKTRGA
jgi:uncharacterized integral membrane protein